jgi:hypothetical protein
MKLLSVALGVALVLLGVRVLIGTGQRHDCGAPGGAAFMLSVQALGAAPSVTECLSLAFTAPASPTTTPPATTTPAPPPAEPVLPDPTMPYDQAERDCDERLGLQPNQHLSEEQLLAFHECMRGLGHWVPVD